MGIQILAIGEVMLELAPAGTTDKETSGKEPDGKKLMALGYAGDTYNTSIYLTRLGVRTAYFTRLGDDPYSHDVLQIMAEEGLDTDSIETVPGRTPGLYMIANQPNGERSFSFWRGQSPAREMFTTQSSTAALERRLQQVSAAYFSGVTIGILNDDARTALLNTLAEFRAKGGKVIFDNNYRPQLWRDRAHAQQAMEQSLAVADIALLTDDDAERLWGSGNPEDMLDRCLTAGVHEVVIKRGPNPVVVALEPNNGQYQQRVQVDVPLVEKVVDTTAAGDSFNAGYLAARFAGENIEQAAVRGSRCAGVVIQHRGAIVEREIFIREIAYS